MKSIGIRISSVIVLAILFVTTNGFVLFSHFCSMSGEKEISTSSLHDCCAMQSPAPVATVSKSCCDDESQFIKLEITTTVATSKVFHTAIPVFEMLYQQAIISQPAVENFVAEEKYPPPQSGRDLLSAISVFRI